MKHAPRCSNESQHAPAEPRAKGPQINAAAGAGRRAPGRPWTCGRCAHAHRPGPWTTLKRCPLPAPSTTCPQPSTNAEEPSKPEPRTLAASTTDQRSARPRGQASSGSYLVWKRLAQREQDLAERGIAVKQVLKPAEVLVDASLLSALLHAALDWSLRHARTPVDFLLDMKTWPAHARFVCRFGHVPADQVAADASPTMGKPPLNRHVEALDCLSWRLLEQLGHTMQLPMQRIDTAGDTTVTIEFPQTASDSLTGTSAKQAADRGVLLSGDPRPLAGNQVLVIASRRDIGNQIRHAVAHMGLALEFVDGVDAARTACQHGLPHAIIYESAARDRGLDQLRADISHQQGDLAWIEITEHGEAFEVSSFGGMSMARVGRDAIATSLPSALMFELAKGL